MTDEQYIDELFAREVVGMDTPGFRDFVPRPHGHDRRKTARW